MFPVTHSAEGDEEGQRPSTSGSSDQNREFRGDFPGTSIFLQQKTSQNGTWQMPYPDNPRKRAAFQKAYEQMWEFRRLPPQLKYSESVTEVLRSPEYSRLKEQELLTYDPDRWPLRATFCAAIGLQDNFQLERLHAKFSNFNRDDTHFKQKKELMAPFRQPEGRAKFTSVLDRFVAAVIAPHVAERLPGTTEILYQAFPCIRIQQPCDHHTLRMHCDAMYCHQEGTLNFWVPLTAAYGTNSLQCESHPGAEDYAPFTVEVGQAIRFHAAQCAHYTIPNTTDTTRVSFDLRVLPAQAFDPHAEVQRSSGHAAPTQNYEVGDYYSVVRINGDDKVWEKIVDGYPSVRHGFPFTNAPRTKLV